MVAFKHMLERLVSYVRLITSTINVWTTEWGDKYTNARGLCLMETFNSLPVAVKNDVRISTLRKDVSDSLASRTAW